MGDRMPTDAQARALGCFFGGNGLPRAINFWHSTGRGTAACMRFGWVERVEQEVIVLGDIPVAEMYLVPTLAGRRALAAYRQAH